MAERGGAGAHPGWGRFGTLRARLAPTELPWRRPRFEFALLVLVAVTALLPVVRPGPQDTSRLCLTRALTEGRLTIVPCAAGTVDQARYDGHTYTDKAPGLSALAIPAAQVVRLPTAKRWSYPDDAQLWAVRLLSTGLAFVVLAFAVGRVAEGLAPGWGGPTLVTFALGTLVASLAPTMFGHVPAAAFAFAAFLLAWRRRDLLAGLAAGVAVTIEYQVALVAAVVALYVLLRGLRPLVLYAAGALPPLLLLAAYDWAAFGSPFHLSYRYVANDYAADQAAGFFGIGVPHAHALREVFVGNRGLLVMSPVVLAAAGGLVLLWRSRRAETAVAATVVVLFALLNCGYFLPYGGGSPGPRFFAPALPFLLLGLAPAFARWPLPTIALAAISIAATAAVSLTWDQAWLGYPLVWSDLLGAVTGDRRAEFVRLIDSTALGWVGLNRIAAAAVLCACAAAAFALALLSARPGRR